MKSVIFIILISVCSLNAQNDTACKCCSEKYTEFDFWLGEWKVTNADGSAAGNNTIEKIQDQCILIENWVSASPGYTGTSYNFYNAQENQWEQLWIDNQGGYLKLKGHRKNNRMILQTDKAKNNKGESFIHRITWTKNQDDTVRQLWETITNDKDVTMHLTDFIKKSK